MTVFAVYLCVKGMIVMYHEPIPAYDGSHPFIFACFCREDEDIAYPVLARLYNEETMPEALRDAHKLNDTAVALAYGFEAFWEDEARIVAELMKLYKALTKT